MVRVTCFDVLDVLEFLFSALFFFFFFFFFFLVFFFSLVRGEKSGWKLRERVSRCRALRFIRFSKHFLAVEVPNKTQKKKKKKKKVGKVAFF
jgi:hypothetical protein